MMFDQWPIQATSKGSDLTARMRRLVLAFAGRTYHIVGNLRLRLKCGSSNISKWHAGAIRQLLYGL